MGNAPSTDAEKSASQSEGGVNIDLMDKWSLPEMPAMPIFGQDSTGLDRLSLRMHCPGLCMNSFSDTTLTLSSASLL
jgi:hypothetical protein